MTTLYIIGSVILVSIISIIAAIPLLLKKKTSDKVLLFLLSVSVGVLLSAVFMNLLPEAYEEQTFYTSYYILAGFIIMFVLENLVHSHHQKKCETGHCGHSHAYHLAPINLIGDGLHNFIDGLVIAGAYAVNVGLGITTTLSVIFHEIPQEITDFGILLYSGLSKKKAVLYNFLSALTAILGAILGIFLTNVHNFVDLIVPFAAGNFLYIAASNLLPQLHHQCKLKDSIIHVSAIILGILIMTIVIIVLPHTH